VSDGVVLLKGKAGQHSVEFSITVDSTQNISPADAALPIHRLAAKAQIKQLENAEKGALLVDSLFFVNVSVYSLLGLCMNLSLIISKLVVASVSFEDVLNIIDGTSSQIHCLCNQFVVISVVTGR